MLLAIVDPLTSRSCFEITGDACSRLSQTELVYMLMQLGNAITISTIRKTYRKTHVRGDLQTWMVDLVDSLSPSGTTFHDLFGVL